MKKTLIVGLISAVLSAGECAAPETRYFGSISADARMIENGC